MEPVHDAEAMYQQVMSEARHEALAEAVEELCNTFQIELSDERRQELDDWDSARLKQAIAEIAATRRWPGS